MIAKLQAILNIIKILTFYIVHDFDFYIFTGTNWWKGHCVGDLLNLLCVFRFLNLIERIEVFVAVRQASSLFRLVFVTFMF